MKLNSLLEQVGRGVTLARNDLRGEDSSAMKKRTKRNATCSRLRNENSYFKGGKQQ